MPPMEIERKFTVKALPENLDSYPFHLIEQAYLNTDPVLRIRRQDDEYYLTYKSPPPLQGVARLAGYNPLTPDSVSRRPDFLFVQVTIALDALLMPLEGAFVLLRLNP